MPSDSEAAAARAAELLGVADEAPEDQASDTEEASADAEAQHEEVEQDDEDFSLNLTPKLPEDLEEELDAPDPFAEEDDDDLSLEVEERDEMDDYDADDPRLQKAMKKLAAAEKRLHWVEQKRAEAARGKWEEEAKKYFPLSAYAWGTIDATSRRGFLREAKAAHEAVLPHVSKIQERYQARLDAEKEKAREEARAEAEQAWGKPTLSPSAGPAPSTRPGPQKRQNTDFAEMVRKRLFENQGRS